MRYHCSGCQSVEAEGVQAAAEVFANRLAKRHYGRRGYCRTLRLDSWTQNQSSFTYQAFIGRSVGDGNTTAGHNIWLYISRDWSEQ